MSRVIAPVFDERKRAHDLIREIAGHVWRGKSDMLMRVHAAIRGIYPDPRWTLRRVRSMWHREQAITGWREIRQLEIVAAIEARRRRIAKAAHAEHEQFLDGIVATVDRMEATDAEFHRERREALRQMAIGSDDPSRRDAARERAVAADMGGTHLAGFDQ